MNPAAGTDGFRSGSLALTVLDGRLAICRLPPASPVPEWATRGAITSITRTPAELSIVCAEEAVPADVPHRAGWACLQVAGPLAFSLTGILAGLSTALAAAGVSVFAVSTFDTDYLLVPASRLEEAVAALAAAGHEVT